MTQFHLLVLVLLCARAPLVYGLRQKFTREGPQALVAAWVEADSCQTDGNLTRRVVQDEIQAVEPLKLIQRLASITHTWQMMDSSQRRAYWRRIGWDKDARNGGRGQGIVEAKEVAGIYAGGAVIHPADGELEGTFELSRAATALQELLHDRHEHPAQGETPLERQVVFRGVGARQMSNGWLGPLTPPNLGPIAFGKITIWDILEEIAKNGFVYGTGKTYSGPGVYFTTDHEVAETYAMCGGAVITAELFGSSDRAAFPWRNYSAEDPTIYSYKESGTTCVVREPVLAIPLRFEIQTRWKDWKDEQKWKPCPE